MYFVLYFVYVTTILWFFTWFVDLKPSLGDQHDSDTSRRETQKVDVIWKCLKVIISAGVIISYRMIIGLWREKRLSK